MALVAAACDDDPGVGFSSDGGVDAGACVEDRFGLSRPDLPAADFEDGDYTDLQLCNPAGDWFSLVAGPGYPVRVTVAAASPVRVVLLGLDGLEVAAGEGAAVELNAWQQPELRVGVLPVGAGEAGYALRLEAALPADRCEDGFDLEDRATLPAVGGRGGVVCAEAADAVSLPVPRGAQWTLAVAHTGDGPAVVEIWDVEPSVRRFASALAVGQRLELPVASAGPAPRLVVRAAEPDGRVEYHLALRRDAGAVPVRRLRGRVGIVDRPLSEQGLGEPVPWRTPGLVVDAENGLGVPLAAGLLDAEGAFDLAVAGQGPLTLRVRSEAVTDRAWVRVGPGPDDAAWALPVASLDDEALDLELQAPLDDPLAGALHVAATAAEGLARIEPLLPVRVLADPPLQVRWQPGAATACGTCFRPGALPSVDLSGRDADPDEWDDFVILHELGHYAMALYSHDDSPGGAHDGAPVAPVLAWSEGLAHYHSAWQRAVPRLLDAKATGVQVTDLEVMEDARARGTADGRLDGDLSEYLVAALLWDLTDAPEPDDEPAALPEARLFETLFSWAAAPPSPDRGAPGVDLVDLLAALVCDADRPEGWREAVEAREMPFDQGACAGKASAAVTLVRRDRAVRAQATRSGLLELAAGGERHRVRVQPGQVVAWTPPAAADWVGATLTHAAGRDATSLRWAHAAVAAPPWQTVAGCAQRLSAPPPPRSPGAP